MTAPELPFTSADLRGIADALEEVEATTLAGSQLLGRIEVYRPDGDNQVVGWVTRFDESDPDMGWGFVVEVDA